MSDVPPPAPPAATSTTPVATGGPTNGLAIATLVLGILAIVGTCASGGGIVFAIAGLITGYMGKNRPGQQDLNKWGLILSWVALILNLIAIILALVFGIAAIGAGIAAGASGGADAGP